MLLALQSANTTTETSASAEDVAMRADITRSQSLLKQFSQMASTSLAFNALQTILLHRPASITINQLDYTRGVGGKPGTILVTGSGSGRDAINTYRLALEAKGNFADVSVPVSALAGADAGRFTMTITGTF
jgi:hypothetical protein